jgi:TonB family protein
MLECGQPVTVLAGEDRHAGWLKVRTKKGATGYLDAALAAGASGVTPSAAPLSLPPFPAPPPSASPDCRTTPAVIPQVVYRVEPRYTGAARVVRRQGSVGLCVTVSADGAVRDVRVLRHLGYGLDENAVDAVRQWRFRPVASGFVALLEVSFSLAAKPEDSSAEDAHYRKGYALAAGRDYRAAMAAFRLAALRGHADARFALGKMYTEGLGVAQDYALAHVWLSLAAASGSDLAAAARDELSRRMTPQQISEAQALARNGPPQ